MPIHLCNSLNVFLAIRKICLDFALFHHDVAIRLFLINYLVTAVMSKTIIRSLVL